MKTRLYRTHIYAWFLPALCAFSLTATEQYDIPLRINGALCVPVDHQYPGARGPRLWVSYPELRSDCPAPVLDSTIGLLTARFGSEIGDPHINTYTGSQLPNRDHMTDLYASAKIPAFDLTLYGLYHYEDIYSDKYDSLWEDHILRTGDMRAGSGSGTGGLIDELTAGYAFNRGHFSFTGTVTSFSRWGVVPVFFTPSWQQCLMTSHTASVRFQPLFVEAAFEFKQQSDYYDHLTAQKNQFVSVSMSTGARTSGGITAAVLIDYNNVYTTASRAGLLLSDSALGPFEAAFGAGADVDGSPWADAKVALRLGPFGAASLSYECGQRLIQPDQVLYHLDTMLVCTGTRWFNTSSHLACSLSLPTARSPSVSLWCDYFDTPVWYQLTRSDTAVIRISETPSPFGPLTTVGARLLWNAKGRTVAVESGVQGHIVLDGGPEVLSAPWNAWIGLNARVPKTPALNGGIRFDAIGPVAYRFIDLDRADITRTSVPARTELSAYVSVPVLLPRIHYRFPAAITVTLDHVQLSGGTRALQHPMGNLTGPRIEITADAEITEKRF